MGTFFDLPEIWYNTSVSIRGWIYLVLAGCLCGGILLRGVFKDSQEIRKWVNTVLFYKVIVAVIIFDFVYPYLYETLTYLDLADGYTRTLGGLKGTYFNICMYLKRWVPVLVCFCLLGGGVANVLFYKSKEVRKGILNIVIIKIPAVSILTVYILCLLYGRLPEI